MSRFFFLFPFFFFLAACRAMYSVYIIYSLNFNIHYIGHTSDITERLKRHNSNRSTFTKNKGPWELVASFPCNSKSEAYHLELKLKSLKNAKKAIEYLGKLKSSWIERSD